MSGQVMTARVLLVDDDPAFIVRAASALEQHADLKTAQSGRSALSVVTYWQPDVILLDMLLDDLDGFTFLEQLSDVPMDRPPFILCTTDGRGANTRVRPLPNWKVGTVLRSSTDQELLAAVMQAARAHDTRGYQCLFV